MSILHFVVGIGVGLLAFLLLRPERIGYEEEPPRRASSNNSQNYFNQRPGDQCSICLENMNAQEFRPLLCGHALHKKCYDDCMKRNHKLCPLCKQRM